MESSAPQRLESLIRQAEAAGASDVHLHMNGPSALVFLRLDGVMTPSASLPRELAERVFGRIKYLAQLKTYQDALPQDGRIEKSDLGARHDIRVSTYPTVTGEKIVLRFFQEKSPRCIADLEFGEAATGALETSLRQRSGLLLLTGPAGSGKTTTIHACLHHLNRLGGRHIITVEDPVEQIVPGITQTEVNEARGLTYAVAARHLLRQDPEVLVVGEIRDEETAGVVVRAALTGHLVIATLHAGSCRGVVERLLALCPDRGAVLTSLDLILNQRLLRRVCGTCAGRGCGQCLDSGYRGRLPAVEWIRLDEVGRDRLRTEGTKTIQPAPTLSAAAQGLVDAELTLAAEYQRWFPS